MENVKEAFSRELLNPDIATFLTRHSFEPHEVQFLDDGCRLVFNFDMIMSVREREPHFNDRYRKENGWQYAAYTERREEDRPYRLEVSSDKEEWKWSSRCEKVGTYVPSNAHEDKRRIRICFWDDRGNPSMYLWDRETSTVRTSKI